MNIISEAEKYAIEEYKKNDKKHDWSHITAVRRMSQRIAKGFENVDLEILDIALIFHDIGYHTGRFDDKEKNAC